MAGHCCHARPPTTHVLIPYGPAASTVLLASKRRQRSQREYVPLTALMYTYVRQGRRDGERPCLSLFLAGSLTSLYNLLLVHQRFTIIY